MDQMIKTMFASTVLPVMRQLDTDSLKEIQEFLNEEVGKELARRATVDGTAIDAPDG